MNISDTTISSCSFPSKVLKWMKANAKPKMALKLMKCHKYFQHLPEFPYFVVKTITDNNNQWYFFTLDGQMFEYNGLEGIQNIAKKFWITEGLNLTKLPNLFDNFIPKIAVCEIKNLRLENQKLVFDEFKFLIASGYITEVCLRDTVITFENGGPVFIPDILKCLPNVEKFYYYNGKIPIFSSDFFHAMKDINVSKLQIIGINIISFSYFEIFLQFMDLNPHIRYELYFIEDSLSPEETENLENFVETILDFGLDDIQYPPPYISFPGQSEEQIEAQYLLTHQYYEKKNAAK